MSDAGKRTDDWSAEVEELRLRRREAMALGGAEAVGACWMLESPWSTAI